MFMAYLTISDLTSMGFKSIGDNVLISEKASIYGAHKIDLGSNIRIDDFSVISAGSEGIKIGSYVHIATQSSLIGDALIVMDDFSGISSKVSIFSSSDDYLGRGLTNPMIPDEFKKVKTNMVHLKRHALIGANTVILPGTIIGEGTSVGALSIVNQSLDDWSIYVGNPIEKRARRSKKLLEKENLFLRSLSS